MLVRCERCKAAFVVQDGLAAPGFRVECGRCLFVFSPEASDQRNDGPALQIKVLPPKKQSQWKAPLAAILILALAAGGFAFWRLRRPRLSDAAAAKVAQGDALLLRDDLVSLEGAAQLFTEAAHLAPHVALPEAQRAFALLLESSSQRALQNPAASTRLLQQGIAAAKTALSESPREPAAQRAMGLAFVLSGAPQEAARFLSGGDPWTAYVRAAAVTEPARAIAALEAARKLEPGLLRAEVDEAQLLFVAQPQRARELVSHVLLENPRHELARRLAK
jgi:predicted Zn finger-like uncharacterized protein